MRLGLRQSVALRGIVGWSDGALPIEREFAVGGIGSVRAHAFKEAVGRRLALFNAEYGFSLAGRWDPGPGALRLLLFYDAGRVGNPTRGTDDWLTSVGIGVQTGPVRVEWGFRPDDIPKSAQVLVRLGRTF
jgi:outer membrane protein assembly factor BamA